MGHRLPEQERQVQALLDVLRETASGAELIGWGYPDDVRLAADVDADTVAPDLTATANPRTPASPPRS